MSEEDQELSLPYSWINWDWESKTYPKVHCTESIEAELQYKGSFCSPIDKSKKKNSKFVKETW